MDQTHIVEVEDLRRHYGPRGPAGFEAVRGVSFSVRRGELFAVLGTNGSGKTSTMEVLEGLARPSAGTVRVLGQDPARARQLVRPRIGIMLQEGGLPGDLTVAETARMWAGTLTSPRPVDEVLELVDLRGQVRVTVKQLSGGQRRRLDLALAILGRPDVLFLDEPTAGLDPESRARTWRLIRHLLDGGTTVLLTTHYLQEAEDLADRLAILHQGRIVSAGTPRDVAAARPARISFVLPANTQESVPELPAAVGIETQDTAAGRQVIVHTHDLQRSLGVLLAWGSARHLTLGALDARSASLEEAFLDVATSAEITEHQELTA
jgi:ABC-2 type transport system ATP-binding protein